MSLRNNTVEISLRADPAAFIRGVDAARQGFTQGMQAMGSDSEAAAGRIHRAMSGGNQALSGMQSQASAAAVALAAHVPAAQSAASALQSATSSSTSLASGFGALQSALAGVGRGVDAARQGLAQGMQAMGSDSEAAAGRIHRAMSGGNQALSGMQSQASAAAVALAAHVPAAQSAASALQSATSSSTSLASGFGALQSALAGIGFAALAKSVIESGLAMERINAVLVTMAGSSEGAGKELDFVRGEADRLGLKLDSAAEAYGKFAVAAKTSGVAGNDTRHIFTAVATAATAMKLSGDETKGAFLALSQMMSKGTVQAEELKGQLGERLPGAFGLAARAMGVTEVELGKMLEQGQVMAKDLLPKLADLLLKEFAPAAEQAAKGAQSGFNRLFNTLFEKKDLIARELNPALAQMGDALSKALNSPEATEGLKSLGVGLADLVRGLTANAGAITTVAEAYVAYKVAALSAAAAQGAFAAVTGLSWVSTLGLVGAGSTTAAIATGKLSQALILAKDAALLQIGMAAGSAVTALTTLGGALKAATLAAAGFLATPVGAVLGLIAVAGAGASYVMGKMAEEQKALGETAKRAGEQARYFAEQMGGMRDAGVDLGQSGAAETILALSGEVKKGAMSFEEAKRKVEALSKTLTDHARQRIRLSDDIAAKEKALAALQEKLAKEEKERIKGILETKKQAAEQALQAARHALDEELKKEEEAVKRIRKLREDNLDRRSGERSTLRDIKRRGMSEEAAEADRVQEVEEGRVKAAMMMGSANQALGRGDLENAAKASAEARKYTDEVLKQSAALKDAETAQKAYAEAMQLSARVDQQAEAIATKQVETQKGKTDAALNGVQQAKAQVDVLNKALENLKEDKTIPVKAEVAQAQAALGDLQARLAALQDKTITITTLTKTAEAHAAGGLVGALAFSRGGMTPSVGREGVDSIPALLAPGEYVIKSQAVRHFGVPLMDALNAMQLDPSRLPRFAGGGLVRHINIPELRPPVSDRTATLSGSAAEELGTITLNLGGKPTRMTGPREAMRDFVRAARELERGLA
ncbi:MAG: tape measure protein [Magnetococcales bacterium]|nr:tape measure protein [Magnetococcales bacterium]